VVRGGGGGGEGGRAGAVRAARGEGVWGGVEGRRRRHLLATCKGGLGI